MNVRQFGLKNANSQADEMYDLMSLEHFFESPDGLGWGRTPTVERIGQTWIVTDEVTKQPGPSGKMWFPNYEEYEQFLRFCQVGGLILCYKPSEQISWRYLDCTIEIKKSELDHEHGWLSCGVTFTGTSRWYEDPVLFQADESEVQISKEFAYDSDSDQYCYSYRYNDEAVWNNGDEAENGTKKAATNYYYRYAKSDVFVGIENGAIDSYFVLTIFGPCVNPEYKLYKNSSLIHTGKINVTLTSSQKLVVDTHPKTMEIATYTITDKYLSNAYGKSDFTTERIFALPPGYSSMAVSDEGAHIVQFNVEVKKVV